MNPEVTLCPHLSAPGVRELRIEPGDVLEWYDGPVTAIARCVECPRLGLLEILDWSRSHRVRIFALAGLEPEPLATYQRNVGKGSCDPARLERETAALLAAAGPVERIVAVDVDGNRVLRAVTPRGDFRFPAPAPWLERLPRADDDSWFSQVGLEKAAR